jgi:hypothetical protein
MTDTPRSRDGIFAQQTPLSPQPSYSLVRDKVEGILAYSLLGAVICAVIYFICRVVMFFA